MLYLTHALDGSLIQLLYLLHLFLTAAIHHHRSLGEGGAVEYVHHHLELTVLAHLSQELIFVF